jgi:signal transduction histidine kinase
MAYGIILAATLLVIQIEQPPALAGRIIASSALLAMVPWYALVGRAVLDGRHENTARAVIYLAGLGVLFAIAASQTAQSSFILFALSPQCLMVLPFTRGVAAASVFSCLPVSIALLRGQNRAETIALLGIAVLGVAFSVAFGGFVKRIIDQSRERAELIEQLEATRAELAAADREAGVLAERQRLSSEIHDTIAQGFTSIVMLIQAAEAEIVSDPAGARRHLLLAAETARENLAEARVLVAGLAPAQLDGGTLDDALRRLTAQAADQLGIGADFQIGGSARTLGTGAEVMLLRVCQEALSNVRKHARARQASVRLTYGADEVRLEICDDGAGFDPASVNGGYGLRGMRARVGEAGGSLTVRSAPGEGTSVSVEVPA